MDTERNNKTTTSLYLIPNIVYCLNKERVFANTHLFTGQFSVIKELFTIIWRNQRNINDV